MMPDQMPTQPIPYLDAPSIRGVIEMGDLIDAVERAFRIVAGGRDRSPLRSHVDIQGGSLLLMPGLPSDASGFSVKLVTVMPGNAAAGRPTVQAIVVWFDAATGRPLAILDGETVTGMRTGAASGVATRLLAREDAATLAMLGVGAQAEWQVRAVLAARPVEHIIVFSRTASARHAFAARIGAATGVRAEAVDSAEEAVRAADVVCCATTAVAPVLDAAWVRPGTHVNGIGAFRIGMVELPAGLFGRGELVAVDARRAALAEAGDVVAAIEGGPISESDLVEIGSVPGDYARRRDPDAITIFKSVGLAIQDAAAAELIAGRLLARAR